MAKFVKVRRSLPKRIAGVKIPRELRRAADTPLGAAVIAYTLVELGRDAMTSQPVRNALVELRGLAARMAMNVGAAMQEAAQRANGEVRVEQEGEGRRRRRRPRMDPEEMTH